MPTGPVLPSVASAGRRLCPTASKRPLIQSGAGLGAEHSGRRRDPTRPWEAEGPPSPPAGSSGQGVALALESNVEASHPWVGTYVCRNI